MGTLRPTQVSDVADTRVLQRGLQWLFQWQAVLRPVRKMNVTPLIDVLLTLIVVFMVVVSMDKDQGETAQIPQPDQKQTQNISQPRTVVIQVAWKQGGEPPALKINQEAVRWEDLEERLARIYLTRAEKVAFVRGDPDVDFQYVADVIDRAHHAGVPRVGLLTKDKMVAGE
jgi:biopolymer transport protein ExbD